MNILLTNDDGIFAPGILELAKVLSENHNITVVAPDINRSGTSASISLDKPLRIYELYDKPNYYKINGSPVDCIRLALHKILSKKPDLIISGINAGANLGRNIIYSGTVAAAIEGKLSNISSIAVSSVINSKNVCFRTAALILSNIIDKINDLILNNDIIFNINIPDCKFNDIKGIKFTHQADNEAIYHMNDIILSTDGKNRPIYWYGRSYFKKNNTNANNSLLLDDYNTVNAGYVSITPLLLNMTDYATIDKINNIF